MDEPQDDAVRPATDASGPAPDLVRRRRLTLLLAVIAAVAYVLDQLTKLWAVAALGDGLPRPLLGSLLRLQLIRNPGAAFSLGTGSTWVLTVVAVVVLVVIVRFSRRLGSLGWAWAFGLLLGGALGNLTDRLVREPGFGRGHVVDFIDYYDLFIGNVADIAIVAAAVLIALLALRGIGVDGRREGRTEREPADG
ncbi:signal peptidase II [Lapillicoccus jejuensis]|uniref:Lipoprotein signal peptidase n=1 Tax=Lapillicoccus jejuensis TaxID=402171 RepID=A0A542E6Q7_9MICO|nr:signal peptidase II [Lapillicoccus jejuensis]